MDNGIRNGGNNEKGNYGYNGQYNECDNDLSDARLEFDIAK